LVLEDLKLRKGYDGFLYLVESARNPPRLSSHHHRELEVNLVLRGTITYVVGERRFTFTARTLLWLFPEQEHQLVDMSPDAQAYVAVFRSSLVTRSARVQPYAGLRRRRKPQEPVLHTVLEPASFDLIRRMMDALMIGAPDPDLLNREAGFGAKSTFAFAHEDSFGLNAGLHHLLLLCWRCQKAGRVLGDAVLVHPVIRKALRILSNEDWNEDMASLAGYCAVSEAHLSRLFHRQIGVPLTRYRNSLRLSRFWKHYGDQQTVTLAEAVYAAGFGSYSQFHKVFTQAYGRGPRAYLTSR
jgi:AraC-like DNA-binding protein